MLDPFITPDPMMQELQAIRDAISREIEQLPAQACVRYFRQSTEELARELNCDIVPEPSRRGAFRLGPRTAERASGE